MPGTLDCSMARPAQLPPVARVARLLKKSTCPAAARSTTSGPTVSVPLMVAPLVRVVLPWRINWSNEEPATLNVALAPAPTSTWL